MADLRLLKRWFVRAIAAVLLAGCTFGPIWAREVRGRVVDRETGKPVVGVEVFVGVDQWSPVWFDSSPVYGLFRWATTDEKGRFVIPGEVQLRPAIGCTSSRFAVLLYHPQYGAHQEVWAGRDYPYPEPALGETLEFDLKIFPDENLDEDGAFWQAHCLSYMEEPACAHLFELQKRTQRSSK